VSQPPRPHVFIAYTLPAETASAIVGWAHRTLGEESALRPVTAANLHVTLVFCGPLPAERIEEVVERTRAAIVVRRAPTYTVSRVRVRARSVIALELDAAEPDRALRGWPLGMLAYELSNAGLRRRETRDWTPHITIARARRGQTLSAPVEAPKVTFRPDAIAVFQAVNVLDGVRYDERARFPLLHA